MDFQAKKKKSEGRDQQMSARKVATNNFYAFPSAESYLP